MKTTMISILFLAAAMSASAQSIYIGMGPSIHSEAPHGGLNLTTGLCTADGGDCALVNYSGRFDIGGVKLGVVYSTVLAERHVLASTESGRGKVDLFTLAHAGASVSPSAVGFTGAGGGGISFHPKSSPLFSISVAAQADYSPVNPGWRPNVFLQVGYLFKRQ